jgi:hypothetical protein
MNRYSSNFTAASAEPSPCSNAAIPESGREALDTLPIDAGTVTAVVATRPEGRAASNPSNYCRECDGAGEVEILALDAVRPVVELCHACEGSGLGEPVCETCQGALTSYGFCFDCADLDSRFVLVERIAPGRIAL